MNIQMMARLLWQLHGFHQRERWTREQLVAHQAISLQRLRDYVYARSPFYQRFHRGLINAPLHELPVLTKASMMEHFDELVTDSAIRLDDIRTHLKTLQGDELYLRKYRVNATSGSTGHPGIFLFNHAEWATAIASFARGQEWGGLKVDLRRHRKMAVVSSTTPHHMSFRVGMSVRSPWVSTLRLAAAEPLDTIVQQLNDWQPDILVSYASMARILAHEQLAGRLHVKPSVIFTSSEVLTDETRRLIEGIWGKILFNEYAATESGGLAGECDHHQGLHLFEDLVIFEVVDENYQPVPPGTFGDRLLITGLFNYSQPLIRYELSDSLRLAVEPCASGKPFALIDGIQGRREDVLYLPSEEGGETAVQPVVFHQIMDTVPASGWQVVQEQDGLKVLLSGLPAEFVEEQLTSLLRQALVTQQVIVPPVTLQRVPTIPKSSSGKAPLIKSNVVRTSVEDNVS